MEFLLQHQQHLKQKQFVLKNRHANRFVSDNNNNTKIFQLNDERLLSIVRSLENNSIKLPIDLSSFERKLNLSCDLLEWLCAKHQLFDIETCDLLRSRTIRVVTRFNFDRLKQLGLCISNSPMTDISQTSQCKHQHANLKKQHGQMCGFCTVSCCQQQQSNCTSIKGFNCPYNHFIPIYNKNTNPQLGDCKYLDQCHQPTKCKYVHYRLDHRKETSTEQTQLPIASPATKWINIPDLRKFDLSSLGKFAVVIMDPPWQIQMDLAYNTLSDEDIQNLSIDCLQDEGFIFLWTTARAMRIARLCLKHWGYTLVDEIVWVKINQLHHIARRGRTGHWLNHSKEHCLVGVKGNPLAQRLINCDIIVSQPREPSRKPDELYDIIDKLCPKLTKKLEIFGREHNLRPGWLTIGNQLSMAAEKILHE